ncbi:MAG: hypothetical protein BMS9Abin11_0416 [Gammaproteobacteria bacterium]|nr:MAG: hypothetical protein BMS9Abin11_0416 [Gammaproteobacteria bacterium]
MLIKHEREKLLNSIVYFAENTESCGKTKLIKLLSILDFGHYKQTGRSVTGMDYYAWDMGPVPIDFYGEIDCPPEDLVEHITISPQETGLRYPFIRVVAQKNFDPSSFSRRELKLLEEISEQYKAHTGSQMIEITHHEDGPWAKTWRNGEGKNRLIPYVDVLNPEDREEKLADAKEYEEFVQNYS